MRNAIRGSTTKKRVRSNIKKHLRLHTFTAPVKCHERGVGVGLWMVDKCLNFNHEWIFSSPTLVDKEVFLGKRCCKHHKRKRARKKGAGRGVSRKQAMNSQSACTNKDIDFDGNTTPARTKINNHTGKGILLKKSSFKNLAWPCKLR